LHSAANAARLAARRCSLVELKELVLESPTTTLQIDGHEIAVTLRATMPANEYGLRVDRRAYPDPLVVYSDAELPGVIAEAVGLDLSDLAQRRRAQQQAQLACRRLAAIVAYRASARLGDPNDATDLVVGASRRTPPPLPFSNASQAVRAALARALVCATSASAHPAPARALECAKTSASDGAACKVVAPQPRRQLRPQDDRIGVPARTAPTPAYQRLPPRPPRYRVATGGIGHGRPGLSARH
jgi:hypothetical protein